MKGFAGTLILLIVLITTITLINSTHIQQNEDNLEILIPKINNFASITEINLKNMASDCNWDKESVTIENCIIEGISRINLESIQKNHLFLCENISLTKLNDKEFKTTISCREKIILEKNTYFNFTKSIYLIR